MKRWSEQARRDLLAELEELRQIGFACNVQKWSRSGYVERAVPECKARRRVARQLLKRAIDAVKAAKIQKGRVRP